LATLIPAAAHASSVINGGSYLGAPGETNQITISRQDAAGTYTYTDAGVAAIDPPSSGSCTVSGNQATCPRPPSSFINEVFGGDQADTIVDGQPGYPFAIDAGSGADQITSAAGDLTRGGPGNDHLVGGPGNDILNGGPFKGDSGNGFAPSSTWLPDNDRIEGLAGADALFGDVGDDVIDGGDGNDQLEGDSGNDTLRGGAGNDLLDDSVHQTCSGCPFGGGNGSDILDGGDGNDHLVGAYDEGAPDIFACGSGLDLAGIGAGDQVNSDCEQIEQLVSCLGGGPCQFVIQVSATAPATSQGGVSAAAKRSKRTVLGTRTAKAVPGLQTGLTVGINPHRLNKVLRGDGRANGVLDIRLRTRKKGNKGKRIARTPFELSR
jgi:Ca2+-binding RTX toxin-like protein